MAGFSLFDLETTVAARGASGAADSWTAKLFASGIDKAAQKLGEEAVETVIAAIRGEPGAVISESADLLYHLLVVLAMRGVAVSDVMAELERRTARSGLAEKSARAPERRE